MSASIRLAPRRTRMALVASGAVGIVVAAGSRFVDGPGGDPIARILALAFVGVVPLALAAIPSTGKGWDRLLALAAIVQPLAGIAAVASLWLPTGPAGLWTSAWMGFALLLATMGARRALGPGALRDPATLTVIAGLLYLPVGAAWLVMARMGARPLGVDGLIVTLTAVHFHFAGLATPIFVGRAIRALDGAPGPRSVAGAAGITVVAAIPIVAAGIALSPELALVGAVMLAMALLAVAGLVLFFVVPRTRRVPAKILFSISALSLLVSMPLAVLYQLGAVNGSFGIELEWMVRIHGFANAHGFVTCGLLAWVIEDRPGWIAESPADG